MKYGERKQGYEDADACEHDYEEHEDANEYICTLCGDRQPLPLDRVMRR